MNALVPFSQFSYEKTRDCGHLSEVGRTNLPEAAFEEATGEKGGNHLLAGGGSHSVMQCDRYDRRSLTEVQRSSAPTAAI